MNYLHRLNANLWILFLLFWSSFTFAAITVELEPTRVKQNETFRLTLTLENVQSSGVPDLMPLQQYFDIVSTQKSKSYTVINGQAQSLTQWSVLLQAKKVGVLDIPAISIGQQHSLPTKITILPEEGTASKTPDQSQDSERDALMLTSDAQQKTPFVNEQVVYTVKLFTRDRLADIEYQPPHVEDALLFPLGEGRHYQTLLNGYTYQVEEQQYVIFPQKPGTLSITPPSLRALLFTFEPSRVQRTAKKITLTIQPIPAQYTVKDWLIAKQVGLTESYDALKSNVTTGHTLTRIITLQATGVPAELLPTLTFQPTNQYSLYPEKPTLKNDLQPEGLIGTKTLKMTYLLNQTGEVTIPAIHFKWFNSVTRQAEEIALPARTIQVNPKTPSLATTKDVLPRIKTKPDVQLHGPKSATRQAIASRVVSNSTMTWIAVGFALAWFGTLLLWWFKSRVPTGRNDALRALQRACKTHDPKQVQVALLDWAKQQWPNTVVLNVHDVAKLVDDLVFKKQLSLLSQVLYSAHAQKNWRADALWQRLAKYKFTKHRKTEL